MGVEGMDIVVNADSATDVRVVRDAGAIQRGQSLKRGVDLAIALIGCALISPLICGLSVVVALEGRPILFGQWRVGQRGVRFRMYKFRSMVPNADIILEHLLASDPKARVEWESNQKLRNDPRITRLGNFLRQSSLDELPQLLNVVRGEMSLIGPRPVVPDEIARYGRSGRFYRAVKPGVTGLWQVSGRNDTSYRRRVAMDRYYASNASLQLDFWILYKTVVSVLLRRGVY